MVGGGNGVTLLPTLALGVENRRGQLAVRRFKSPPPMRKIVMAWRKGSAMKQPLVAIASAIRKAWPQMNTPGPQTTQISNAKRSRR